ncbi:MAG: tRNA pseudouridine(55) synthase TruB [Bacteroidia bacterium]|nr:tRNA pseudouridine(55) synthase TruB [Bacteroidia bacterium]
MDYSAGGVLLINKPRKWTSFDVVGKLRWSMLYHYGKKVKIGHAGTLDPLATGLLILCTGMETRNIEKYQAQQKEYEGEFFIGATTPSLDLETETDRLYPTDHIDEALMQKAAASLTGTLLQEPPAHSAKRIGGKRAYQLARAGKPVELKKAEITVNEFQILSKEGPLIRFRISCSKGTYIRSLARDFGLACGSGAYLHSLVRTRIGEHTLSRALTLEQVLTLFPPRFDKKGLPL